MRLKITTRIIRIQLLSNEPPSIPVEQSRIQSPVEQAVNPNQIKRHEFKIFVSKEPSCGYRSRIYRYFL